jgi:hypothetical protein
VSLGVAVVAVLDHPGQWALAVPVIVSFTTQTICGCLSSTSTLRFIGPQPIALQFLVMAIFALGARGPPQLNIAGTFLV